MRVVIDGRMILPEMRGVGRYLLCLSIALRDLGGDDFYELWVQNKLPAYHPVWDLKAENFYVRNIKTKQMSSAALWRIPWELARTEPDLFHFPHFDLPFTTPGRVVATIHDLKYIVRPDFFPQSGQAKRLIMRIMMDFTCRRAQYVIVVSQNTAQDLVKCLRVPQSKIRVIPHGVDTNYFTPRSSDEILNLRNRYNLSQPYLLFVGERRPHKNLVHLIEAFSLFHRMTQQPYQLVIAGRRYSNYQIPEKITQDLILHSSIRFIDNLIDKDLPALYQGAEAFILPSYYEGFGLPVLEAMACGIPVVASNRASLPEVVGEAGILVDPDDPEQIARALCKVITGGELREYCISAGLERARSYTWERCAHLTYKVYREALN